MKSSNQHIEALGTQLERNRLLQNIPQAELANRAGISPRTLRRLESGEGGTLDSFVRVLIALGIDNNLGSIIPDSTIRPMERASRNKSERLRASRSKKSDVESKEQNQSTWTWGDEAS